MNRFVLILILLASTAASAADTWNDRQTVIRRELNSTISQLIPEPEEFCRGGCEGENPRCAFDYKDENSCLSEEAASQGCFWTCE